MLQWLKRQMTNPHTHHRAEIRKGCDSIRRALHFVRPHGGLNVLQEVINIECTALAAHDDQLPAIRETLERLIQRLKGSNGTGLGPIIAPERWRQFFSEE